jgi:hypothetical protein
MACAVFGAALFPADETLARGCAAKTHLLHAALALLALVLMIGRSCVM